MWQVSTILYFALKFDFANSVFVEKLLFEQNQKIRLLDLFFTLNLALGLTFLIKFIRVSVKVGDIYGLSKKPLSFSIAGDSGVGKDSLSNEISKLFEVYTPEQIAEWEKELQQTRAEQEETYKEWEESSKAGAIPQYKGKYD